VPNTTVNALPYPAYGTGADGPAAFQALADAVAPKLYRAEPLTGAQIAAIGSPRIGQLVFNTDLGRSQEWNGTTWRSVGAGASGTVNVTTPANGNEGAYSFFVGTGFSEVDWQATVTAESNRSFGAMVTSNASIAILRTNGNGAHATLAVTAATNTNFSRVADTQGSGVFLFNCYYNPSNGMCYFSLSSSAALTQRINWRAR